jgi:pyruvate dehydrogenase E2 component (dihydrolipoamide acetyltransferase)
MAEFVMPQLGADMSAGKLLQWRKKVGDRVQRGDIIADVETDKADIEVEVFSTGTIEKILIQPGEKVPVGTLMAVIREEGKPTTAGAPAAPQEISPVPLPRPPLPIHPPHAVPAASSRPPEATRIHISPVARKLAADLGIDPATVSGTGPGGRITLEDIQLAAKARETKPAAPPPPELDRAARMRQAVGAAMARSKREIPHYYLSTSIDVSRAMAWLAAENLKRSIEDRLVYGVLLLKAVALTLREFPELNGFYVEGKAVAKSEIHVGAAISLRGGGLVAPAIHNTDRLDLGQLMRSFRDLVQRARVGSLRSSELSDPTITVTNLGERGVEAVFGVIYPPQVALVGFGKIVDRPWASEGQITIRSTITATFSGDHRVSDGHRGGLFLAAIERLLQEPSQL